MFTTASAAPSPSLSRSAPSPPRPPSRCPTTGPVVASKYTLPHDFQTADTRDAVVSRGLYEPITPSEQRQPPQDLRNPDTVDFANGRGTYNAPEVVVVKAPEPSRSRPPAASTGRTSGSEPAACSA